MTGVWRGTVRNLYPGLVSGIYHLKVGPHKWRWTGTEERESKRNQRGASRRQIHI